MSKFLSKILGAATIVLLIVVMAMNKRIDNLNSSLDIAVNNNKAYAAENSTLKSDNIVFKYRIEDMSHMNDSIINKMLEVTEELKIKNKKLETLQYQMESIKKTDTLYVRDTIFRTPDFVLDTCISDHWAKTCIHLEYPSKIGVSSEFNNEKYIITSWKKEPIKQRKWFLPRWFTRKQKIITVDVVDKNPYVTTERQRFVQIVD